MKKFRAKTKDVAFQFRMGAGMPGDVNRTHPASIEPALQNTTNPSQVFGGAVVVDSTTQTVRRTIAGDTALTSVYGFHVLSYPTQSPNGGQFGAETLGSATPPTTGPLDVLRSGYIMAKLPAGAAVVRKGQPVHIWIAATAGNNVQGGVQAAASGANTITLTNATFNGTQDAQGVVEIAHNI